MSNRCAIQMKSSSEFRFFSKKPIPGSGQDEAHPEYERRPVPAGPFHLALMTVLLYYKVKKVKKIRHNMKG